MTPPIYYEYETHTYILDCIVFLKVSFCVSGAKGEEVDERDSTTPALDNFREFGSHLTGASLTSEPQIMKIWDSEYV